jgi:RHS repeat-associated protein
VPGSVKSEMVYDKRDRMVYSIDGWGRQILATTGRTNGVYARYDELNRVVESGYYKVLANQTCGTAPVLNSSTDPRAFMQCKFDAATAPSYDFLSTAAVADKIAYLNNFYDVYPTGDDTKFNLAHAYNQAKTIDVKGMMVKTIDKVLQNNILAPVANILNPNITTLMFYDNLGRSIQSQTLNHTNQTDISSTQLDFAGRITFSKSTTNYTWRPSSGATTALTPIVIESKTTYDYGGRVSSVCQKNDADSWEPVVRNTYSKIGELLAKKQGCDVQNVDYQYNIRSWLTKINDPANLGGNNRDLFGLNLTYNDATQFNGNITKLEWNTLSKLDNIVAPKGLQQYVYGYDKMNRLLTANFSSAIPALSALGISVSMINAGNTASYDQNGNIQFLKRTVNAAVVDNLTYGYETSSNRIQKIDDAGDKTNANYFVDITNATDYTYDANGNMKTDVNKAITSIAYTHANLPTAIISNSTIAANKGTMKYYYSFTGKKVRTEVLDGTATAFTNAKTVEYVNGLAFKGGTLEFIPTAEGRALAAKFVWSNATTSTAVAPAPPVAPANQYRYEYQLKDHLGDLRLSCRCGDPKRNAAGDIIVGAGAGLEPTIAVQENHYDPWGLGFADAASNTQKPSKNTDRFQYNGKEKVSDLGLGLFDYGARHYDPTMGRWISVDPLAEKTRKWTPYNYALDNPLRFIDADGMEATPPEDTEEKPRKKGILEKISNVLRVISRAIKKNTGVDVSVTAAMQSGFVGAEVGKNHMGAVGMEASDSEKTLFGISDNQSIVNGNIINEDGSVTHEDSKTSLGASADVSPLVTVGAKESVTMSFNSKTNKMELAKDTKALNVTVGAVSLEYSSERDVKTGKFQNSLELSVGARAGTMIGGEAALKAKVSWAQYDYNSPRTTIPLPDATKVNKPPRYIAPVFKLKW